MADPALTAKVKRLEALVRQLQDQGAWEDASYQNGWVTQASHPDAQYLKWVGGVWLRGTMDGSSATAQTAFTLPEGYRPGVALGFPMNYWDGAQFVPGKITVGSDGAVDVEDNTSTAGVGAVSYVNLAVVQFFAA